MNAVTIGLINIGITLFGFIVSAIWFCIIKFNDFKHMEAALNKQSDKIDCICTNVTDLNAKVAKIEGKIGL